jgi:hypothetical protein
MAHGVDATSRIKKVCELLGLIEHFTGTKFVAIGNGPSASDLVYIERSNDDDNDSDNADGVDSNSI